MDVSTIQTPCFYDFLEVMGKGVNYVLQGLIGKFVG